MRRSSWIAACLWLAVVAAPTTAIAASFERGDCPFAVPAGALHERLACGQLVVPERHEHPHGAQLRLPVVIIRSTNSSPRPDPVVFLAGGPGAATLASAQVVERFAQHPFARDRDIILYNQRGSPQTAPELACRALDASRTAIHAADLSLHERDARLVAAANACFDELRDAGRDLDAYGAVANAHDLHALRSVLALRQWNLLAVSYGTWMALEAVRVDPHGVRSLVLDSIMSAQSDLFMSEAPRNFSLGLDRLIVACAADVACVASYPDLAGRLRDAISALDTRPVVLRLSMFGSEEPVDVVVNWHDFLSVLHWMLYNAKTLRLVPALIDLTSRGDLRLLGRLMEQVYPGLRHGAPGPSAAFFVVTCRDQFTSRNPLPMVQGNPVHRGFSIVGFMSQVCSRAIDDVASRPPLEPVRSAVPALLLSGRFDPMTPDVYAAEVAASLTRVMRITIADSGHSTMSDFDACQTQVAREFLATLDTTTRHPCLAVPSRPNFVLGLDDALSLLPAN